MSTRTATVALGVVTFALHTLLLIVAIVRTVLFGIWAGAQGAYVTADPPPNINSVLWSSVAAVVWTLLLLAVLFVGLVQMVRYRPSGPYLVAAACVIAVLCDLPTWIAWKMDWSWGFLLVIPLVTLVFALLPSTRRVPEAYSLATGA